jgi:hypothetical protein
MIRTTLQLTLIAILFGSILATVAVILGRTINIQTPTWVLVTVGCAAGGVTGLIFRLYEKDHKKDHDNHVDN